MKARFASREDAARQLAERLAAENLPTPCLVLALPRGGVPIGAEVARRLDAPLDLLLVRKIGAPGQPELAVAVAVDGNGDGPQVVLNADTLAATGTRPDALGDAIERAWREIERRRALYRGGRPAPPVQGTTVIVVDDGIATGTTVRAALQALRRRGAARIVLAVPLAPHDTLQALQSEADRVVCLAEPSPFRAVGLHYDDFHPVSDAEVLSLLQASATTRAPQMR